MTVTGIAPIKQGLVKALRDNAVLKAAVHNDSHEAFAPESTYFPFIIYQFVYSPYAYDWGGLMIRAGVDVWVYHRSQVEAHNLDALVTTAVQDVTLDLTGSGQRTLFSRRVADLSSAYLDESGTKVYQVGGTFELWTDQSLS